MSEHDSVWEQEEHVRRSIVLARDLCEKLAAEAARRGVTFDELMAEYLAAGLGEASKG